MRRASYSRWRAAWCSRTAIRGINCSSPIPRHARHTPPPPIGPLPQNWNWGADFLPALLRWLTELMWPPPDDGLPQGRGQVSFMELGLDFESHAGRPLPPTPQMRFKGKEMSLQEKGRVLQLAVTLLDRALGTESILPAAITTKCRSFVPLGAGTEVGVKGRPIFTRPMAVWHHLQCTPLGCVSLRPSRQRSCCPAVGAVRPTCLACPCCAFRLRRNVLACCCRARRLAFEISTQGARRGPQYEVEEQTSCPRMEAARALFTPQSKCPRARRPETRPWLPRLWLCDTHQYRQCAACAAVGRGVRHCCTRGHRGHPRRPAASTAPCDRAQHPWGVWGAID